MWPVDMGPIIFSRMKPPRKAAGSRASMALMAFSRASWVLCLGGRVESWPICIDLREHPKVSLSRETGKVLTASGLDIAPDTGDSDHLNQRNLHRVQHHREPPRVGVPQEVRRRVPPPFAVEYGPAYLRPDDVVVRKAVVWSDAGLQQSAPHRRLPLPHRRLERHNTLHPSVRLIHEPAVPPNRAHVLCGRPRVETCVETAGAAEDPSTRVYDAVLGDEALGGGRGGEVREGLTEGREGEPPRSRRRTVVLWWERVAARGHPAVPPPTTM
ncbi:nucleotide-diphospho-sugar transferase superfamily protein [Striga asiatica]|uniref:Nucleotide-diphospho-sugar transferase superfamily protein n=1 Tax=Striga asiatica TaxID=4170 RepID=A0A5A7PPG2_STRAF|nr:nucleotide-diphospho-sugar transferase superfamily protein [Striga asiatica]